MKHDVYDYIIKGIKEKGALHMALIDQDNFNNSHDVMRTAKIIEDSGVDAIMVGGSSVDREQIDMCIKAIKKGSNLPVIIFPGGVSQISPYADAIYFMTLMNSRSRYWLSLAQALASFSVYKANIEAIPMGYIVMESPVKSSVAFYGDVNGIPPNKPKIAASYALAAQYLGMKVVYLEAGSGAPTPVPDNVIKATKEVLEIPLIVGGGIRDEKTAYQKVKAGADIIVTGNIVENAEKNAELIKRIASAIHKAGGER
ncbi:geranylgeranylglyceryl/heptaprenylglyceryl phosphate synthase [Candidatus Micrarchaeota archaeon]|nr:MAG: geranylgeranylglyceryl/heptaprenylglyceryl phosphate synthase [Candidatus Micrarchaeota archaeon]